MTWHVVASFYVQWPMNIAGKRSASASSLEQTSVQKSLAFRHQAKLQWLPTNEELPTECGNIYKCSLRFAKLGSWCTHCAQADAFTWCSHWLDVPTLGADKYPSIDVHKTRSTKGRSESRFLVRYEPSLTRFYMGSGWPGTNKRVRLGQETKHGGLARHGPFTLKSVKPIFCTNSCLPDRLARFGPFFPCLTGRSGPFRPAAGRAWTRKQAHGLRRTDWFSNRAQRVRSKIGQASPGLDRTGRPV